MSIASEISRLQTAKQNIKTSIEGKGVTVPSNATLSDYPTLIDSIEGGGGGTLPENLSVFETNAFGMPTKITIIKARGVYVGDPVPNNAYKGVESLTSVTFAGTCKGGQYSSFQDCINLKEINFQDDTYLSDLQTFQNTGIEELTVGQNWTITNYSSYVFAACSKLKKVTWNNTAKIGLQYFKDCTSLSSLTINNTTKIDDGAFSGCTSLSSVTIPDSCTNINREAFKGCTALQNIVLPSGLTYITYGTFSGCTSLSSVTIPDSCTNIGYYAFKGCKALTSITIGNGVTEINTEAFSGCTALTSITIPDSVTSIKDSVFSYCTVLSNVSIGSGITNIGSYAFNVCSSLQSITIKATTPPTLGYNPFSQTPSTMVIYVPCEAVDAYKAASGWSTYADRIRPIPNSCPNFKVSFMNANGEVITGILDDGSGTITFSEVDAIRSELQNVETIEIYDSVISLTSGCFDIMENETPLMSSLSKIKLPTTITNIPIIFNNAQNDYTYYTKSQNGITVSPITSTNVYIAVSDTNYAHWDDTTFSYQYYFNNGYNLIVEPSMVTLYDVNDEVLGYLDDDGTGVVSKDKLIDLADLYRNDTTKVVFSNNVTEIGYEAFRGWSGLTTVQHSNNLRTLGGRVFQDCKNLQTLVIPDTVTTIGNSTFVHCEVANTCYIGTGITALGADTFCDAWSLQNVVVPSNVTDIGGSGGGTFARCSGMTSIEIMGQVTNIGQNGFLDDRNLRTITIHSIQPPTVVSSTLANLYNLQYIYVPSESVETYKAASGWSRYANKIQAIPTE